MFEYDSVDDCDYLNVMDIGFDVKKESCDKNFAVENFK